MFVVPNVSRANTLHHGSRYKQNCYCCLCIYIYTLKFFFVFFLGGGGISVFWNMYVQVK